MISLGAGVSLADDERGYHRGHGYGHYKHKVHHHYKYAPPRPIHHHHVDGKGVGELNKFSEIQSAEAHCGRCGGPFYFVSVSRQAMTVCWQW